MRDPQHHNGHTSYGPHWGAPCNSCHWSHIPSRNQGHNCNQKKFATTIKLITLTFTGSQWVCFLLLYNLFAYIFLVLHPRHKLKYLEKAGWEKEWIENAEAIVHAKFDQSYRSMDASWVKQSSKSNVRVFFIIIFKKAVSYCPFRTPLPYLKIFLITYLPFKRLSLMSCEGNLIGIYMVIHLMFLML